MNNSENNFRRVSGVIIDHDQNHTKPGLGEIYISDRVSSISSQNDNENFLKKVNHIKHNNDRSDILIKLHAKPLSTNT